METQFTWTVEWLQCKPQEDGMANVVVTAGWRCTGVFADTTGTVYSTCSFPMPEGGQFTPYADLTQDQVLGWCWANGVDKASAEAAVDQQIKDQIAPPIVQPPLPWAQA